MEWSLAGRARRRGAAVPDRDMLVWKETRPHLRRGGEPRTRRASPLPAAARHRRAARERAELERWECGQRPSRCCSTTAPEYIEAMLGCLPGAGRAVQRQPALPAREIAQLLDMLGAEAVVYHRALGALVLDGVERAAWPCSSTSTTARESRRSPAARLRGGRRQGCRSRSRPAGPVPGRPLSRVHGRHDGLAQGRALAPGRHLRRRDGRRRRPRPGDLAARRGRRPRPGSRRRRSCTRPRSGPRSTAIHSGATLVLHDDRSRVRRAHHPRDVAAASA